MEKTSPPSDENILNRVHEIALETLKLIEEILECLTSEEE